MINSMLLVAVGGALGAMARFGLSGWMSGWLAHWVSGADQLEPHRFPWPTLIINVLGSLVIGLIWATSAQQHWFQDWGRAFLVVGVLGGFTTFSTFSLETIRLIELQKPGLAVVYALVSMLSCVAAAWIGYRLATQ